MHKGFGNKKEKNATIFHLETLLTFWIIKYAWY